MGGLFGQENIIEDTDTQGQRSSQAVVRKQNKGTNSAIVLSTAGPSQVDCKFPASHMQGITMFGIQFLTVSCFGISTLRVAQQAFYRGTAENKSDFVFKAAKVDFAMMIEVTSDVDCIIIGEISKC